MWTTYRYRAYPDNQTAAVAERHIDLHRQLYNHVKWYYENAPDTPSENKLKTKLPEWKQRWPVFKDLYASAAQRTVRRFCKALSDLRKQKATGQHVGQLQWKAPEEYRSMAYRGSPGVKITEDTGRAGYAMVRFGKIGEMLLRYHRPLPDDASIKETRLKKERTGEWYVSFVVDLPEGKVPSTPDTDDLTPDKCVGIDLGIIHYLHTSDGHVVERPDLEDEYERLRREQRSLARKQQGSNNWEKQRQTVAQTKRHIRRKVLDFQRKLTAWLVSEYDAVFVENLDVQPMLEADGNARNKQDAAWRQFISILEHQGDLTGTHVEQVDAIDTTKECAKCGVKTEKPLWVRDHACPSCGFETDRDANAALNVLQRGLKVLGLGNAEVTPVETALPTETESFESVSAKCVIETGSLSR